jgi:hypothetical protein
MNKKAFMDQLSSVLKEPTLLITPYLFKNTSSPIKTTSNKARLDPDQKS